MAATLIQCAFPNFNVGAGNTRNGPVVGGGGSLVTAELNAQRTERSGGVYSGLYVRVNINVSDGSTTVFFRKNTANGNQNVTFLTTETGTKQDLVNTDSVIVTDIVNYQAINGGAVGNITFSGLSTKFTPGVNTVNHYGLNTIAVLVGFGTTNYFGYGGDQPRTTLANQEIKFGTPGTIKNIGIRLAGNTLDATGTAVFRNLVNGADGNITVSFASTETGLKEDLVNTDVVALNDLGTVRLVVTGVSGQVQPVGCWISMETTNNKADYVCSPHDTRVAAQTRWFHFIGNGDASSVESSRQFVAQTGMTLSNYRAYVSVNTWSANTEIRLRKNTANVNEVINFATTVTGWVHDLVNTDIVLSTDLLNHQLITSAGAGAISTENIMVTGEMAAEGGSTLLLMGCG